MSKNKNVGSDIQGITSLVTDAIIGTTDLVEAMHTRIVHPPFLPSTPIQHLITKIAGFTFKNIRWSTQIVGTGINKGLAQFAPELEKIETIEKKETIKSVLNGVIGDHLEEKENPLTIVMRFRSQGKAVLPDCKNLIANFPTINGKILLMVHGSCMNDIQWTRKEHNHGTKLSKELDKTLIYLHYNSGRHISTNGKDLNDLLETLILQWPVPIEELVIVAHSMGGLVCRSAYHYGQLQKKSWTKHLKKLVFLGTPHHGAPLEKLGNYLDVILEAIPYAKPFARLGKIRSAGVTDLRYGNLVDEDWQYLDRFKIEYDKRQNIPLPDQVEFYSIAGVTGKKSKSVSSQWLGDNMVGVKSALGQHENPDKDLRFKKSNTWVAYENNHLDLLSNPEVYKKIKLWML